MLTRGICICLICIIRDAYAIFSRDLASEPPPSGNAHAQALVALKRALETPHATLRLSLLSELVRGSVHLRPPTAQLHGCGRKVEWRFDSALHKVAPRCFCFWRLLMASDGF